MTMTERTTWATVITFPVIGAVYLIVILSRAATAPVAEVSWVAPMIWAMALSVVVIIVGTIASAIGTGAVAAARGEQPEFEEGDVRDRQIGLLGDARSYPVVAFGGLAAIILAMVGADPFWFANAIFLSGILASTLAAAIKLRAYRTGV